VLFSGEVETKLMEEIKVFGSLVTIILCHAIIAIAIFYDHEEDHKFHDWQGPQGHLLCIVRLVIFGAFLVGLCTQKKSDNPRQTHYMRLVSFAGTLYLLSLPVVVVFTNYALETVSQQNFIVFGSFACQMAAVGVLYY
jgi:cytochrome b561